MSKRRFLESLVDPLIAFALAAGYVALLLATVRNLGYARDEGFYFHAASDYKKWFDILFTHPSQAVLQDDVDIITLQALERGKRGGEGGIEHRFSGLPVRFEGRDDEVVLALEKVVKTPLFDAGALADGVDPHRAVALPPDQFDGGIHEVLPGVADATRRQGGLERARLLTWPQRPSRGI